MASDLLGPLRRYPQLEPSSTPLRGLSILTYRSSGSNAPAQMAFSCTLMGWLIISCPRGFGRVQRDQGASGKTLERWPI